MKKWQPIQTAPLDKPIIVTDGKRRKIATLQTQKPVWRFEELHPNTNEATIAQLGMGFSQVTYSFVPTHWFSLPDLPVER